MTARNRRVKKILCEALGVHIGGDWSVESFADGRVTLVRVAERDTAVVAAQEAIAACKAELLRVVALRCSLGISAERMRNHLAYRVPWADVQLAWRLLSAGAPVHPISNTLCLGAFHSWMDKAQLMVQVYCKLGKVVPEHRAGRGLCLSMRLSIDGTVLWVLGLEVVTLSFGSPALCSNPDAVHPVALCLGHESTKLLASLLEAAGLDHPPQTFTVTTFLGPVEVDLYLCADHQARVRLGQCDGPTSQLPERRPCAYCDAPPADVHTLHSVHPLRAQDRRFAWDIGRSPPDPFHLLPNVVSWALDRSLETLHGCHPCLLETRSESMATHADRCLQPFRAARRAVHTTHGQPLSTQSARLGFLRNFGWRAFLSHATRAAHSPACAEKSVEAMATVAPADESLGGADGRSRPVDERHPQWDLHHRRQSGNMHRHRR